jgi:hypothetical protein
VAVQTAGRAGEADDAGECLSEGAPLEAACGVTAAVCAGTTAEASVSALTSMTGWLRIGVLLAGPDRTLKWNFVNS